VLVIHEVERAPFSQSASFPERSKKRAGFARTRGAIHKNPGSIKHELNKFMFGPIIVFVVAVSLVATYIFIVNRLLRSDEHWNEKSLVLAPVSQERPATASAPARSTESSLRPSHA
jgi:hypothetical protein